ncbi:hypothetical protein ACQPZZ_25520 [Microbispora sp. CA-135349]|uniref:hypothetical protein n=1 Tax=Microbispora sp. CA-135349 TaxID=3239953 RepID=UPI003D900E2D
MLVAYGIGMFYGAVVHAVALAADGFISRPWAPLWLNAYWNGLLVLDALSGALLLRGSRRGLYLTCATLLTDLFANVYAAYVVSHSSLATAADVDVLVGFILFVLLTAPRVGRFLRS